MIRYIFNSVKNIIPKVSDTELIALRSGSVSIDRDIMSGKVILPVFKNYDLNKFPKNKIDDLCSNFDNSIIYPNNNDNKWIKYLGENNFFSFLIDEKYGGNKLSNNELSNILTKITSVDPALGVVSMVPNSLGPGELLSKYGTEYQKEKYLPGLADGTFIPCFGLTGPQNGSDATGSIDKGILFKDKNNKLKIRINLNKRYITLAPVSNLMGIAFNLEDPNDLIHKKGITLALVERDHPGLIQESYHNPLNVGFPNGTIKGSIDIDIENIIGGHENIGNGWKMLMECLSAGRGISLPATANASSKIATIGIYNYIQLREQFNIPLQKMEAIQEKFTNMILNTWIIQSSIQLTNDILDSGKSPSVISAIMKQQCTERGRIVINEGMDIHAGASICIGYNNFLEKFYRSVPVGITVEGSNTLTRSLIIFGQGLNKSHPYIFKVLDSILENDVDKFRKEFSNIISHSIILYLRSFSTKKDLDQQIINFACLTNFVALKGGLIKKEQKLSGDMADIFSNLYLALSVQYYHNKYNISSSLTEYIITDLLNKNQVKINTVIDNLPYYVILSHMKKKPISRDYENDNKIFDEIMNNKNIINEIKKNIYYENSIIKEMEDINTTKYDNKSSYEISKNNIINVDEYIIK